MELLALLAALGAGVVYEIVSPPQKEPRPRRLTDEERARLHARSFDDDPDWDGDKYDPL